VTRRSTRAVHGGTAPDRSTGALLVPIHQSTTYAQQAPSADADYVYSRQGNPTVAALERRLASLAGAEGALAFSSGMAAIDALLRSCLSGDDHVVVSEVAYGGTPRLLSSFYEPHGVDVTYVDTRDPGTIGKAIRADTQLVLLESPANPTLRLADVQAARDHAEDAGVPLAVDNTFLTPLGQDALELGADVGLHSTTKYIEGHNATIGGAIATDDPDLREQLAFVRKSAGTNQTPQQAWLTLQGVKTLPVRLERVTETAHELARRLADHPRVERTLYPGLGSFAQHALAKRQHDHHGGLLAFDVGTQAAAAELAREVSSIQLAENLGATETLVTHPATMTHASLPADERRRLGITPGLLRLSVGLEDVEDLWTDLEEALAAIGGEAS